MSKFGISKYSLDRKKTRSKVFSTNISNETLSAFKKYLEKTGLKPGTMIRLMICHCLAEVGELDRSYLADTTKTKEMS